MLKRLFIVSFIMLIALAGQSWADNYWDGSTDTDWGTADNWSAGHVPQVGDGYIGFDSLPGPVLAAGTAVVVDKWLVGWPAAAAGEFTLEAGSSLTTAGTAYIGQNAGGTVTLNSATLMANGQFMVGNYLTGTSTLTLNGNSYAYCAHAMYLAYNSAGQHGQVNLFGGELNVGSIGPNLGTWEIYITDGTLVVRGGYQLATVQGYIDAGNIVGDVPLHAVLDAAGDVTVVPDSTVPGPTPGDPGDLRHQTNPIGVKLIDADATMYGTFQSHNQKVLQNGYGIFMTHIRSHNANYTAQQWRLSRSINGGQSFATILEETNATYPPVIETDEARNIYLIRQDFISSDSYLYIFSPGDNYASHSEHLIPDGAAQKFSMYYDSGRARLYYFSRASDGTSRFYIITLDGTVIYNISLLVDGTNATSMYPQLTMDDDGVLYAAWTTEKLGVYMYWSIHFIRSVDGGYNWQKLDGTPLTIPVVCDETGPAERITLDDEYDYHTWLWNFAAKNGKLHFAYEAQTTPARQHYVRYDIATATEDGRMWPEFKGDNISLLNLDGFVALHPDDPDSLFWVSRSTDGKLGVLYSEDNGQTWYDHAKSSWSASFYAMGGFREVTSDGHVIGSFTEGSTEKVYFFNIPPVIPYAVVKKYGYSESSLVMDFNDVFGHPEEIKFKWSDGSYSSWITFEDPISTGLTEYPVSFQLKSDFGAESGELPFGGYNFANVSGDTAVNLIDFAIFAAAWQSSSGQANWDPECDIYLPHDDKVDESDLNVFIENWLD